MEANTNKQNYRYHAKAVAVSGKIKRPIEHDLGEIGVSELHHTGGYEKAERKENHRVEEFLSFRAAYSHVTGSEGPKGVFNTQTITTIEKLNVLDMLKADVITARLVGIHHTNGSHKDTHPWIIPLGSHIVNLWIGGREYPLKHPEGFHLDPEKPPSYEEWKKTQHGHHTPGETFHIPHFGKVTFFKYVLEPDPLNPPHQVHKLIMLALDLGSPVEGSLLFAAADQDGGTPP